MKTRVMKYFILLAVPWVLFAGTDWSGYDLGDPDYFAQGEINVRFNADVSLSDISSRFGAIGASEVARIEQLNVVRLKLPQDMSVLDAISYCESMPDVVYAEPVVIMHVTWTPNDPLFGDQWSFDSDHINMPGAWDEEQGGSSSVIIAIVDTGIAYEDYAIPSSESAEVLSDDGTYHRSPDLAASQFVAGYDMVHGDTHPNDQYGHGTHVAGTAAQATNNSVGVAGMAFNCKLMPVQVLGYDGSGYDTDIADGIVWAVDNGADVINLSLGGPSPTETIHDAIIYAVDSGVVVVASAGNLAIGQVGYPAAYDECISVAACDYNDELSYYSQYGSGLDISAPGGDVTADQNSDGDPDGILQNTYLQVADPYSSQLAKVDEFAYQLFQGTSMAAPHVSGLVALLISHGITTVDSIKDAIYTTARDLGSTGYDQTYGWGMIDPVAALNYGSTSAAPVADFVGDPTSGPVGLTVSFTDQSTGDPTSWLWDFGDSRTSTSQNPVHQYPDTAGTYSVTLIVSNADGADTLTRVDYIHVGTGEAPVAAFSGTPRTGTAPLNVTFTDQSTGDPTSWSWTFGDGATSTQQSPVHSYADTGSYDVRLIVTNSIGSDTLLETGYITVTSGSGPQPPVADFSATPTSGDAPLTVGFTDLSSGVPTSWSWDFGDGGSSTEQSPSYTYNNAGTYTVSLTATNADGSDTETKTGYITVTSGGGNPPVAVFSANPSRGYVPLTHRMSVQFTDQSTGTPTSWNWDFGDGGTSTDQNPLHVYTSAGAFTVSLIVTNAASLADTASDTLYLLALPSEFFTQSVLASAGKGTVDILYGMPVATEVEISLYNINGQYVRRLLSEELPAGEHTVSWDLKDEYGLAVSPGVYFVRLEADQGRASSKIIVVR